MARGPYQGTFQPGIRPTVVTAPDAMVFINGESDVLGCPKCQRKFDFNKYITSIQVDLSVESAPGSASFNLSIPRHSVDTFYFDGQPLILPMMEVEIFAKGQFLIEGLPQYYPIFWGLTTEISDSYSSGEHTVSVNCADILKWWELCQMNINPAFTQALGQEGRSLFGNVFAGRNPYDVIWTLAQQSFGDVIVGSGSLVSFYKESSQKATFAAYMGHVMQYWESRFKKIRSNLLLYGTRGNAVRGDSVEELWTKATDKTTFTQNKKGSGFVSKLVRKANGGQDGIQMVFDPTDPNVTAFRVQFQNAGQVNFWQSEFQTKLELANAAKDCIGYEFYMDVTGDIVFKPPFYNLDILSNKPVSWIQDIDIIDWDLSESESEVVTQVQVAGSYGGNTDYGFGEEMTPATSVTDYHLLRRYGWRVRPFNSEFMGSTIHMFYLGMDLLDQYNAKRFRGTVNIPLRPELRLGFPVYLAPKDQIWYLTGISHNITFGGRAQTTLTLTAKRSKFIAPRGIGSLSLSKYNNKAVSDWSAEGTPPPSSQQLAKSAEFKGQVGDAAEVPPLNYPENAGDPNPYEPLILRHPKTGRIVGYPNVVMAYTRPFAVPPKDFKKVAGQKDRGTQKRGAGQPRNKIDPKAGNEQLAQFGETMNQDIEDTKRNEYLNNRFTFGMTSAGVYTYLHDKSSVIKEMLLIKKSKIKFEDEDTGQAEDPFSGGKDSTALIRPVSDERGFEVIGHYKYGRNMSLRDGSLILNETADNPGAKNSRAEVRSQPAVSGDLLETLQAQSQGLVAVYTGYPNPAHTIAKLDPTDLQTAGIINPEGDAEFTQSDTNFVDVAPLGSPEQKGTPDKTPASVEASQLSRALTLAELKVFTEGDPSTEECGCLMSRSDLAFINVGYQTQVLRTTTKDDTTLSYPEVVVEEGDVPAEELAEIEARQKAIAASVEAAEKKAEEDALADPTITGILVDVNDPRSEDEKIEAAIDTARDKALSDAAVEYGISVEQASAEVFEGEATEMVRPVANPTLSRHEAISRVEQYLVNLYRALDGPHQEYEKVLRGEYISIPNTNPDTIRFGEAYNQQDLGGVGPPFSPSGRARGGDPAALAQQGSSARDQIAKEWGEFGDELKANPKRAGLEEEIRQAQRRVDELRLDVENMEAGLQSGTVITAQGEDITALRKKLADAEKALADKQQELNDHNQEYPPT
jgi:hypothetical protein